MTKVYKKDKLDELATLAKEGGVIAFPTETVFGLGVVYDNEKSYDRLNVVKNRLPTKPYTLMVAYPTEVAKYAYVDSKIAKIINAFMPGEITILLRAKENVPSYVTHGSGTIGIRVSSSSLIALLISKVGKPLLVPSANKAGEKPCEDAKEVEKVFGDEIDGALDEECGHTVPSTIVDLTHLEDI